MAQIDSVRLCESTMQFEVWQRHKFLYKVAFVCIIFVIALYLFGVVAELVARQLAMDMLVEGPGHVLCIGCKDIEGVLFICIVLFGVVIELEGHLVVDILAECRWTRSEQRVQDMGEFEIVWDTHQAFLQSCFRLCIIFISSLDWMALLGGYPIII